MSWLENELAAMSADELAEHQQGVLRETIAGLREQLAKAQRWARLWKRLASVMRCDREATLEELVDLERELCPFCDLGIIHHEGDYSGHWLNVAATESWEHCEECDGYGLREKPLQARETEVKLRQERARADLAERRAEAWRTAFDAIDYDASRYPGYCPDEETELSVSAARKLDEEAGE